MEGISVFMLIITLVFGILGLVLFFKIWGMTEDVKSIKDNLQTLTINRSCSSLPTDGANQVSSTISVNDGDGHIYFKEIVFPNSMSGKLKIYKDYHQGAFFTKEGEYEILYKNENDAYNALYLYLTTGNISSEGLLKKQRINSEKQRD